MAKNVLETLKYKREEIERLTAKAKYSADQTKAWAAMAYNDCISLLNHVRDLKIEADRIEQELKMEGIRLGET